MTTDNEIKAALHNFNYADSNNLRIDDIGEKTKNTIRNVLTAALNPWRSDMENAPRDGQNLLFCCPGEHLGYKVGSVVRLIGYYAKQYALPAHEDVTNPEKYPNAFQYHEGSGEWFAKEGFYTVIPENYYGDEIVRAISPTHWQYLDKPPEKEGA